MIYFLDTSVIIDYLRDKEEVVTLVDTIEDNLVSSYFCLAELYEGIYRITKREKQEAAILTFFSGLTKVYGLDPEIVKQFGKLRASLKQKGQIIEDIDLFIAATCMVHNATLITLNGKYFGRIEGLVLYR